MGCNLHGAEALVLAASRGGSMENLRRISHALSPLALTILRVVLGFVMAVHGWMKLVDYGSWRANIANMGIPAPDVFAALSTAAELVGGLGLIVGLLTPIAAFGVLCNMLVAIFVVHRENGLLAQNGGFEYPLVLAASALLFLVHGAGPISVDHAIFGRWGRHRERPVREVYPRHEGELPAT
jgi:putative oxidoreductase